MGEVTMTKVFAAGVLAGAYKGGGLERTLLQHAVSDEPVREGRLKREPGEAFCDRKLDLVDSVMWEPSIAVTCPKCIEIVRKKTAKG
jgi:hypothetical protein